MNICLPGACICDAREWEGDTNCMGEIVCKICRKEHMPTDRCGTKSSAKNPFSG